MREGNARGSLWDCVFATGIRCFFTAPVPPSATQLTSARKEHMLATLAKIREAYGSVEQYVVDHCRISPEAVARIRENLVVDLDPDQQPLDWESHARLLD